MSGGQLQASIDTVMDGRAHPSGIAEQDAEIEILHMEAFEVVQNSRTEVCLAHTGCAAD